MLSFMDRGSHLILTDSIVFYFLPWISITEIVVVINSILSTDQSTYNVCLENIPKWRITLKFLRSSTTEKSLVSWREKHKVLLGEIENKFLDFH